MAKKSKKRARQAARRAERRTVSVTKEALRLDPRTKLLKRIFNEASGRHADAALESARAQTVQARREERARARSGRFNDPFDDWVEDRLDDDRLDGEPLDDWLREE